MSGTRLIPRQPDNAAHSPPSRASMLYRLRRQLVKEGFEAVLSRKQHETPAVSRIFDGEKEAKLIALACSKPPKGRTRWTLRLLENKVVELGIVERASELNDRARAQKTVSSRAGVQGRNDLAVAPACARLRDIGHQQDTRLERAAPSPKARVLG